MNKMLFGLIGLSLMISSCSSIKPHARMSVFPKGKNKYVAYSSSYEELEALNGAKFIGKSQCGQLGKILVSEEFVTKDLRKVKTDGEATGLAALSMFSTREPASDRSRWNDFMVEMKFHCE